MGPGLAMPTRHRSGKRISEVLLIWSRRQERIFDAQWRRFDALRDDHEWHERKTHVLSVILIVLFGVGVWFTYPTWSGQKTAIADILVFQSRVSGLESSQRESSERMNQLQEQVPGLQREIAAIRDAKKGSAATGKINELNNAQQVSSRESSGLKEPVLTNQTAPNTSDNRADRKRIDFEVSSLQAKEIAPNLYITLSRADAGQQEIDATLKLGEDDGYVTIRGQGIRKPVLFHIPDESRPIELVFTQISRDGVSGYLMMPLPRTNASK
jgi:cell division protein FtsB